METLPVRKKMLVKLRGTGGPPKTLEPGTKVFQLVLKAFGGILALCFGWIGWILGFIIDRRFAADVRRELYFLFEDHGAQIIPHKKSRYASIVLVAVGAVRLQFARHHDDLSISVASAFAPDRWEPFQLVAMNIARWDSTPFTIDNLASLAPIIRKYLPFLQQALSKENVVSTLHRAIEAENASVEAYAERARANGIVPIIYS